MRQLRPRGLPPRTRARWAAGRGPAHHRSNRLRSACTAGPSSIRLDCRLHRTAPRRRRHGLARQPKRRASSLSTLPAPGLAPAAAACARQLEGVTCRVGRFGTALAPTFQVRWLWRPRMLRWGAGGCGAGAAVEVARGPGHGKRRVPTHEETHLKSDSERAGKSEV